MTESNIQCFFGSYVSNVSFGMFFINVRLLLEYRSNATVQIYVSLILLNLLQYKRCPNSSISSDLEHFLLLVGHFAIPSINLHHLNVCASHYQHLIAVHRCYNCELCKPLFGKSKTCARHEKLRPLNKIQAVSIWLCRRLSVYNQWVCATCRQTIGREFVTNETIELADVMFQRLYNERDDIVFTPLSGTEVGMQR